LKTEQEIKDEIEAQRTAIKDFKESFKNGRISKESLVKAMSDHNHVILALRWVLDEMDRYD
jgi:hypothetical protein